MYRKIVVILLSLCMCLIGAASFSACTDPFDDEDNQMKVEGKTTVRIVVQDDPTERELMMEWKRGFEQQNDKINIYVESFSGAYQNEMLRLIAAKDMPDITWVGGNVHANFTSNGHYVDLRPYLERDGISVDSFNKISIDSTHYNNEDEGIWFIPRDYNEIVTFVNEDMLRAAQIAIPSPEEFTEDLFYEICGQLREAMDNDVDRSAGLYSANYPLQLGAAWDPIAKAILASYGGYDYGPQGELGLEEREAKLAYRRIGEYVMRDYALIPSGSETDYFPAKKCAFTFGIRPYLPNFVQLGFSVNVLPFPFEKTTAGCSGYGICSVSKVKDEAWEFIKYIISEEGQNIFGESGMGIPSIESQWETTNWKQYYRTEEEGFNHSVFTTEGDEEGRVLDVNSINVYDPSKHLTILQNTCAIFGTLGREATWKDSPLTRTPIPENAYRIPAGWDALDTTIKGFLDIIKQEIAK